MVHSREFINRYDPYAIGDHAYYDGVLDGIEKCCNGGHDRNSLIPFSGLLNVGRGYWIGNDARIIGLITIGDHFIIGAGSVVITDVPNGLIVAGNPARVIGERNIPEKICRTDNSYFNSVTFQPVD